MKIKVNAQPVFLIVPSKKMVELLMFMSEHHYDATCKNMSKSAGQNGQLNGLFVIWKTHLESIEEFTPGAEAWCNAGFRDLDLTLKVCENNAILSDIKDRMFVLAFVERIRQAMSLADDQVKRLEWELS